MKTLIIYGSKHGCAEKCSRMLAEKIKGEVSLVNIHKHRIPDINTYDNIVIGGSIYVGKIQKEISEFCQKNIELLKSKKLGLFICCMMKENESAQLNSAFPKELLDYAVIKDCFGGEFRFKDMNSLERLAVKMVSRLDKNAPPLDLKKEVSRINEDCISTFADRINEA